ncbi:hypothetical protein E1B28_000080 [Marasmius oreades]|uniref:Methyltransferase n=1 Tax=Marasmius oreades TaxID=181124 RepID=A0A9P7V0K3_9AGAR|nr:uncharacterized protein E1B28_000080 [Marasmius oreades]KAG7098109.1 hypothetical protein E1B28_000080 [Marasmius oreades]
MGITGAVNQTVSAETLFFPPAGTTDGTNPHRYLYPPPPGKGYTNYTNVKQRLQIENIRGKEGKYTLDEAGFQYIRETLKYQGFDKDDQEDVKKEYYPEVIDIIKKTTGASEVIIFDHKIRRHIPGKSRFEDPVKRGVVPIVHADETPVSSVCHVHRNTSSKEEAEGLLNKPRFQIINIWRPITHPAFDHPLAVCDYRSVDLEKDLVLMDLKVSDSVTDETYEMRFNPKQEWKYLRGMRTDEVLLMKCHDSIQDGSVATLVPHAAFSDPSTPPGSPFRESIEVRALVFYD